MTLYVNFFAGPGAGKSTMMAACFAELKWRNIDCEMVTEYAKDKIWEGSESILDNQLYVTANQYHRLQRLNGKVNVVLTDSPMILGLFYGEAEPREFHELILNKFNSFNNLNFLLTRVKPFNPNGRLQSEEESREIDEDIYRLLKGYKIQHWIVSARKSSVKTIVDEIIKTIK